MKSNRPLSASPDNDSASCTKIPEEVLPWNRLENKLDCSGMLFASITISPQTRIMPTSGFQVIPAGDYL
jgi:hypothetical protein